MDEVALDVVAVARATAAPEMEIALMRSPGSAAETASLPVETMTPSVREYMPLIVDDLSSLRPLAMRQAASSSHPQFRRRITVV